MLSIAERQKYILDSLNKNGFVGISDIANELKVSKVTVRKDIKDLECRGFLYKMHGCAKSLNPHVPDMEIDKKENIHKEEKKLIGAKAAEMVNSTDSIIIASGSTIFSFAEELSKKEWEQLNIVTPFLRLGHLFNGVSNVSIFQLGGQVHMKSQSVRGESAVDDLKSCRCSKVFFGVDGIEPNFGITTSTIEEAKLTCKMMEAASLTVVLADSSKFGKCGFGRICGIEDIDVIITDKGISPQMIRLLENQVDLIIV